MNNLQQSCIEFLDNPNTKGMIWDDVTSYSQNNLNKIPTSFRLKLERGFQISITCNHRDYKDVFIVNCLLLNIENKVLKSTLAKDAALEAVEVIKTELQRLQLLIN